MIVKNQNEKEEEEEMSVIVNKFMWSSGIYWNTKFVKNRFFVAKKNLHFLLLLPLFPKKIVGIGKAIESVCKGEENPFMNIHKNVIFLIFTQLVKCEYCNNLMIHTLRLLPLTTIALTTS